MATTADISRGMILNWMAVYIQWLNLVKTKQPVQQQKCGLN